jgi:ribosomal protein S6--L-glutamate ligase
MEVNSSPGLEGIEKATSLDVAGLIIDFIEKAVEAKKNDENTWAGLSEGKKS